MKSLWNTFRHTYGSLRGQILGWGIGLALYGLLVIPMYDSLGAQKEQFQQMIANYPPEFLAFFGTNSNSMLTPAGFLGMYAFSMMPLIIGIFAVIAGSGLIISDEEHGRLDLIIAYPVGRSSLFFGRSLGLVGASVSIMFLGWLGFSALLNGSSLDIAIDQMAVPFVSLLVQTLVYSTLGLFLSMFLPSRNLTAMVTGAILVASYFVSSMASLDERLDTLSLFMPYHYFQSVLTFKELNLTWIFALIGISALMVTVSWLRFMRRDIRLSGEGNWRLPILTKPKPIR